MDELLSFPEISSEPNLLTLAGAGALYRVQLLYVLSGCGFRRQNLFGSSSFFHRVGSPPPFLCFPLSFIEKNTEETLNLSPLS